MLAEQPSDRYRYFAVLITASLLLGMFTSKPLAPTMAWGDDTPESVEKDKDTASNKASDDKASDDSQQPETDQYGRVKVKPRRSSAAALAKGEINFDDLVFDIEKDAKLDVEKLTKEVRSLVGKKVKLKGYILPSTLFSDTNIKQFVLVRDNRECCFGPGAALYDCVMVEMVDGNTADYSTLPVTVTGKFEIDTKSYAYPGGKGPKGASHLAIFRIRGVSVK
ncbi:DUF3299 domain-containing protein [Stieleria varia]|uniref:DUF3299 domain-containing protein n=1 Tax=Stieleria varia TaxID=2528005 RepID=A0A5C6AMF1_9BACT|nr:DUF3299 domain-containing protein [Stieleria varia]TWU01195.1 hypothetical protein Pla52n_45670 [Stieleria varia]